MWFTDKQIAALAKLAKATGLKASEHVRRAIDEYLKRQK
jgi:hypothetical protein